MPAAQRKHILLSDQETASILRININKLYRVCDFFDRNVDDEWELVEGEHFEWVRKDVKKRQFYEAGAVALAKHLQEVETQGFFASLVDEVVEAFTHRRKRIRRHLVRRQVSIEFSNLDDASLTPDLVFLERPKIIRILRTNGKGINASIKRIQNNNSLEGQEQLKPGKHFDVIDNIQYWSQIGIVGLAQDMSQNHGKRSRASRKAWTDTVFEEIEDAIQEQRKYLESAESRINKAMEKAKRVADNTCQVSLLKRTPARPFDLHVHHLFDRSSRPDLADVLDNLLVMHSEIHRGFHRWHGSESCEPKDLIEYLFHAEGGKFETKRSTRNLDALVIKLERIQSFFENHYHMP
ncbi:hypothetical protein VB780_14625 [Leptolyngbya sp. CCNP1308]|uniref:hypothetical protein n=1 Tax=Leptolyngbya sp. CCNP1308 TaxID=3110255 RepID=UPI002B2059ED|nr:hypothetical protein [Leptolyngbya sp. CCNP1308]MEA5449815.1 hypothetical protein [Leptolyngbya sp. CCNP1308]